MMSKFLEYRKKYLYKFKEFNPLKSKGVLKGILKVPLRTFFPYNHLLHPILLKAFYMQSLSI